MIEEKPLTKYNHKLDNTLLDYPTCQCCECPSNFFNLLSIGSRQSGKTYTLVKLLKHYESNKLLDKDGNTHPMRVIVISPTIDNNPVFKSLKTLKEDNIHTDYSDDLLATILEDIKTKKRNR